MGEHDAPAYDLQALMRIFVAAKREAKPGDEVAANPLLWPEVRGIKAVADHMIAALTPSSAREEELREALDQYREELRVFMLEQPLSGRRETYSDGFANGLAEAIRRLDAKIDAALQDRSDK